MDRTQAASEVYEAAAFKTHFKNVAREAHLVSRISRFTNDASRDTKCIDCGKPIPAARIKAIPSATRCITCQSIKEAT